MIDMEQEYAFIFSFKEGKKNLDIFTTNQG